MGQFKYRMLARSSNPKPQQRPKASHHPWSKPLDLARYHLRQITALGDQQNRTILQDSLRPSHQCA